MPECPLCGERLDPEARDDECPGLCGLCQAYLHVVQEEHADER
jgi:hypothetical protein